MNDTYQPGQPGYYQQQPYPYPTPQPPKKSRGWIPVVAILGAVLSVGSVASAVAAARLMGDDDRVKASASTDTSQVDIDECVNQVEPLMTALSEINARLNSVGLTESRYSMYVSDASVAATQVSSDASDDCQTYAADPLNSALDSYTRAGNKWNHCLYESYYCTWSSIRLDVQTLWYQAGTKIDNADHYLTEYGSTI
jgi:hypothetical protein